MVNIPVPSLIDVFELVKVRVAVSSFSGYISANIGTANVADVSPAGIVNCPLIAV